MRCVMKCYFLSWRGGGNGDDGGGDVGGRGVCVGGGGGGGDEDGGGNGGCGVDAFVHKQRDKVIKPWFIIWILINPRNVRSVRLS